MQRVVQSKEAECRRLRELPWLEKLEMLDRLRDRPLILGRMRCHGAARRGPMENRTNKA